MLTPEMMLKAHTMGYAELLADLSARRSVPRASRRRRAMRAFSVAAGRGSAGRQAVVVPRVGEGSCCTA
jgi:hypothetical protein